MAGKRHVQTNGHSLDVELKASPAESDAAKLNPGAAAMQRLIDPAPFADPYAAANFMGNVLESSTETSIIGMDLEGNIQLWNEGARRLYGYEPEAVIGKANSSILHTPEGVAAGLSQTMMATALQTGKFEGRPDLRVLYMSGFAHTALGAAGTLLASVALLDNPCTEPILLARVRQVLEATA